MGPTVGWNSLLIKLFWPKLCSNGSRKGWIGLWPTGWIDTLELKQIFLIFSVCKNAFTLLEIEINFKESQLPFGLEKRIRATRKWPINSLQTYPKKGFFWGYPLPLPNDITIDSSLYLGYVKNLTRYITFHICYELSPPEKCSLVM